MDVAGEWIPIVMFISMAVIIGLFFMFRYRARRDLQDTLRTAIEKGQELTPEIIDRLGSPPAPSDRDLRRSVTSFAIAAGIAALAVGIGQSDDEAFSVLLSLAGFPLFVGIAFLLMHKYGAKR